MASRNGVKNEVEWEAAGRSLELLRHAIRRTAIHRASSANRPLMRELLDDALAECFAVTYERRRTTNEIVSKAAGVLLAFDKMMELAPPSGARPSPEFETAGRHFGLEAYWIVRFMDIGLGGNNELSGFRPQNSTSCGYGYKPAEPVDIGL